MQERHLEIETADGGMPTFLTHPDEGGPHPAVILYMDAPGIREELHDFARRVGTVGYCCLVPDLYYRLGTVRFDRRNMDAAEYQRMQDSMHTLSNAMVMADTGAMLRFLEAEPAAAPGPKATIGYCMSGQFVLSAAGTFPEAFRATASLHGVRHVTDREDSPHRLAPEFRGELYCGFAEHDAHVPLEEVEALRRALEPCREVAWRIEVHPGTEHGYSFPERDAFVKAAAERNWERIFAMLHRQVPPRGQPSRTG